MAYNSRIKMALLVAVMMVPMSLRAQQPEPTVIFSPVKIDAPPHDPANDSYWFGPFSETASVLDVDNDGDMDIVAGRNWYEAPLWIKHENFRPGGDVNGPETENNAEFAMDVDGDGCTDIVSSGWMFMKGAYWYKNPCNKTDTWESTKVHQAFNMEGVEGHHDIDGDGDDDILINHWGLVDGQGMTWLEKIDEPPYFVEHVIGRDVDMHGNGVGDVNMDGRPDIVTSLGWYENPGGEAVKESWTYHPDWEFESLKERISSAASHPILVHDVNEDGLNDVIVGSAHAYGLAWYEQKRTGTNGGREFEEHWIETEHSQLHTLALGDLNGDGKDDLITGRRLFAHYGADIGAFEPLFMFWYDLNGGDIKRHVVFYNHMPHFGDEGSLNPPPTHAFGVGMNVHIVDVDGDGRNDIVNPGKAGLYIFYNQGAPPSPSNALKLPTYDEYESWREWGEYETLFNGRDFSGWVVPEGDGGHWKIENFNIDYDAMSEAETKHLFTEEQFCDYNLHVEWRFTEASGMFDMPTVLPDGSYETDDDGHVVTTPMPNSDSGILLRGPDHQVNIWNWPVGSGELWSVRNNESLSPELRAAAVPTMRADHPIGEWNEFDITLIGDRISVMLNGESVIENAQIVEGVSASVSEEEGRTVIERTPIPPLPECGPIGLQHHGGINPETGTYEPTSSLIQFRNIWIDEIDEEQKQNMQTMEYAEGWEILFDGDEEDLDGWLKGPDNAFVVRDGLLTVDREMDGAEHNQDYLWTPETYEDFVLELDFKTVSNSNSGVFIRTSDIQDPVWTGIEAQVNNSYGRPLSRTGTTGSLYDLTWPRANPVNPPGEWNRYRIIALDNQIVVELNGVRVSEADLDLWTETGKNLDGSENKFTRPIKDFAREGHIGLQDHGRPVWYRNVRIMRIDDHGQLNRSLTSQ